MGASGRKDLHRAWICCVAPNPKGALGAKTEIKSSSRIVLSPAQPDRRCSRQVECGDCICTNRDVHVRSQRRRRAPPREKATAHGSPRTLSHSIIDILRERPAQPYLRVTIDPKTHALDGARPAAGLACLTRRADEYFEFSASPASCRTQVPAQIAHGRGARWDSKRYLPSMSGRQSLLQEGTRGTQCSGLGVQMSGLAEVREACLQAENK